MGSERASIPVQMRQSAFWCAFMRKMRNMSDNPGAEMMMNHRIWEKLKSAPRGATGNVHCAGSVSTDFEMWRAFPCGIWLCTRTPLN